MLDFKRKLRRLRIKYVFAAVCILSAAFFLLDWKWLHESIESDFSNILPVRGVHYKMASYYVADEEHKFRCIVTRQSIDFDRVNDDYCDCDDGSDEPGTAACPNGIFYCQSDVYKRNAVSMPTNRVNDGICDCCDGSDEWQKINFSSAVPGHLRHLIRSNETACPNKC